MLEKIPDKFRVGGQNIDVRIVDTLPDDKLGSCCVAESCIKIAHRFFGKEQSVDSGLNTLCHEMVHAILDTMGENDLSQNEKFVCCFSSMLCEALRSFEYNNM